MLLSRNAILRHKKDGTIIIDPFDPKKLKTTSYDVALGEWFWREHHPEGAHTIHNIYDEASTKRIWKGPTRRNLSAGDTMLCAKCTLGHLSAVILSRSAKTRAGAMLAILTDGRWR